MQMNTFFVGQLWLTWKAAWEDFALNGMEKQSANFPQSVSRDLDAPSFKS